MTDSLTIFGDNFTGVTGIKATGTGNGTLTYIRPQGAKSITENGTGIDVTNYATVSVDVAGGGWDFKPMNDGMTHVWFDITCSDLLNAGLWLYCNNTTGAYIDWGDGVRDTNITTSMAMYYHTYSSTGRYCVTLTSNISLVAPGTSSAGNVADKKAFMNSWVGIETVATVPQGAYGVSDDASYALKWIYHHDGTASSNVVYDYLFKEERSLQYARIALSSTTGYTINLSAFYNCSSLLRVDGWDNVTQIKGNAFYGCSRFSPASLPSGLTSIGTYAFYGCTSLALTSLPTGATNIGTYAFSGCKSLALTSLPSGTTEISNYEFQGCSSLALTSLPSGITSIGSNAFQGCTSLALTSLPSSLTIINGYTFNNCQSLALTSLPSGVTSIGQYAFSSCYELNLTSLPSGVTTIGNYAFNGCLALTLSSLPSSVTSIGQYAFSNCPSMTSISCNGAITNLGAYAFHGNATYQSALTRAEFPNLSQSSLGTVFGSSTVTNSCKVLSFVDVGNVSTINGNAFANCYALQTLVLRRTAGVCSLANISAFLNTPMRGYDSLTGTVYVPNALIATYQTATNWKTMYDAGTVTFSAIEGSQYDLS